MLAMTQSAVTRGKYDCSTFTGVPAVLKFLKLQSCPEIWNCPEISVI